MSIWNAPRIDDFGTIDPQPGGYWKPDSNILLPGYTPVTAMLPGTVTSLQTTSWGQSVITIRLDVPLNAKATHTFYEHLSSWDKSINIGTHVKGGQLIGFNNPSGMVSLGFGLYSGDVYGSGTAWNILQQDLAPGGSGLLNPVKLLNAAKNGTLSSIGVYLGNSNNNAIPNIIPNGFQNIRQATHEIITTVPGFEGIVETIDIAEQFQPFQLQDGSPLYETPVLGGALRAITLPADAMQAFLTFTVNNTRAALIRLLIISIGLLIVASLLLNMKDTISNMLPSMD